MKLGRTVRIAGRQLTYRGIVNGRRSFWCPTTKEVIRIANDVKYDRRSVPIAATKLQRRLAKQLRLPLSVVVAIDSE